MIITRTPYRVSLFGGGTDYPSWFRQHSGAVLGGSINKYCWLMIKPPTQFGPKFKIIYSKVEETDDLEAIQHPAVRECLRFTNTTGAEICHTSDLPARTGVGSSSAFVVGLLHGLLALKEEDPTVKALARGATHIEQKVLKETVGSQDQILTSYGGVNVVNFDRAGDIWVENLTDTDKSYHRVRELEKHLLLFYTGVQRTSSDVASAYVPDFEDNSGILHELKEMVWKGKRILRGVDDLEELGSLLDKSWELKKSLGGGITTERIDIIYSIAKERGAVGGKILGAGGGGFLLLFVPPNRHIGVKEEMNRLGCKYTPFKFEYEGSTVVYRGE